MNSPKALFITSLDCDHTFELFPGSVYPCCTKCFAHKLVDVGPESFSSGPSSDPYFTKLRTMTDVELSEELDENRFLTYRRTCEKVLRLLSDVLDPSSQTVDQLSLLEKAVEELKEILTPSNNV